MDWQQRVFELADLVGELVLLGTRRARTCGSGRLVCTESRATARAPGPTECGTQSAAYGVALRRHETRVLLGRPSRLVIERATVADGTTAQARMAGDRPVGGALERWRYGVALKPLVHLCLCSNQACGQWHRTASVRDHGRRFVRQLHARRHDRHGHDNLWPRSDGGLDRSGDQLLVP